MLHSIYDLTTTCRKTTGDVPPKLVGASTVVVGSKTYLFGGRLVTERRMVSDLYVFDMETLVWEKLLIHPEDDVPKARYFHSSDAWNNQLIIFGGMSNQADSSNPDELCVLQDVRFFDLATRHWVPEYQQPPSSATSLVPRARYAHLSSVTSNQLFIIGGQDLFNTWLDDICVYDLLEKAWVHRRDYPRHCGTYRSVAVAGTNVVRLPREEMKASQGINTVLGPPGSRFQDDRSPSQDTSASEALVHLPYSVTPNEEYPADIFLYSNYNFTDVKRELELFSPLPDNDFTIHDRSAVMSGKTFPPGLRFPTGAILGNYLIIAGTYLAHSYQSFSIWVLDLLSMTWSRIDPGKAVETGSWFRSCLWADANKFLFFGNRNGNLVDDYNRRLLSWDHVAIVDLEAFGIYQPPVLTLDIEKQELGLAALEEHVLADFEIICDDGRVVKCSRKILEERWPWFKEQRQALLKTAIITTDSLPMSPTHVVLPELPGKTNEARLDPRLTPRALNMSEPYPITLALVQYFYSLALITPLQHAPAVLSQLLILATNYRITHLESLIKHAMHRALSDSTSVGVYEVATLCSARSLQIRALKTVMSYTQKRPSRASRQDRDGGSRPDGPSSGGPPRSQDPPSGSDKYISRPRGTSDAKWRTMDSYNYNSRAVVMPQHSRGLSAASVKTDNEIQEFLDLLPSFDSTDIPIDEHAISEDMDEDPYSLVNEEPSPCSPTPSSPTRSFVDLDSEYDPSFYDRRKRRSSSSFHFPRRSRGAQSESRYDSDTPSLLSSASSITSRVSSYQPPVTPSNALFPDTIIEEHYCEESERPIVEEVITILRTPPKNHHRLTVDTTVSSTPSSRISSPGSGLVSSFNRMLLGGGRKDKAGDTSSVDSKSSKAEEKRRKKERKEQLAWELKERAKMREAADVESLRSLDKKKKDPVVSMYNSMDGSFTL